MIELRSDDGAYVAVEQDDKNFVVYLAATMRPLWDRWSHEAGSSPSASPAPGGGGTMRVIPVSDPSDGELVNRMYSYWSNVWVTGDTAWVFAGSVDGRPRLFKVDLTSGHVERIVKWMLPYVGTTEGWSWNKDGEMYLIAGPRLMRVNPFTGEDRSVFDISDAHPGCRLWQAHSSDDEQTHSATVERITNEGPYRRIGTVVSRRGQQDFYPAHGELDESQVDASGRWLVIKEDDDNRIIDLETRETRLLRDADGAVGHSDCGAGFVVGEDNQRGACVLWDLRQSLVPERKRVLFETWNMGYVSVRGGRCLHSGATHLSLVALDGSGETPLVEHGGGSAYDDRVKANLSPCGNVACYMSRGIVYLLVLPS